MSLNHMQQTIKDCVNKSEKSIEDICIDSDVSRATIWNTTNGFYTMQYEKAMAVIVASGFNPSDIPMASQQ